MPTVRPSELPLWNQMSQLPASTKHAILLEYTPRSPAYTGSGNHGPGQITFHIGRRSRPHLHCRENSRRIQTALVVTSFVFLRYQPTQLNVCRHSIMHKSHCFTTEKGEIRKHAPLTLQSIQQVMSDEWNNITQDKIAAHYKHCGLTGYTDVYEDCPAPARHVHTN